MTRHDGAAARRGVDARHRYIAALTNRLSTLRARLHHVTATANRIGYSRAVIMVMVEMAILCLRIWVESDPRAAPLRNLAPHFVTTTWAALTPWLRTAIAAIFAGAVPYAVAYYWGRRLEGKDAAAQQHRTTPDAAT